jgi:hypothetical protein
MIRTNHFFDYRSLRLTRDAQGAPGPRELNSHSDWNTPGVPDMGIDFSTFGNVADPDVWRRTAQPPEFTAFWTAAKLCHDFARAFGKRASPIPVSCHSA